MQAEPQHYQDYVVALSVQDNSVIAVWPGTAYRKVYLNRPTEVWQYQIANCADEDEAIYWANILHTKYRPRS